ncbi:hypothetical protein F4561_006588 [Lipingzhangella halophila]|uniref:Restriction endonuclease n=1 Tax=Lipingzhangella halophila TaxID=1783352 RepID=A0A7W7RPA2_9ACTN|nr:hypothetical protein [Lipingzhangella halophila]MBB4935679.1 hypothetical protein [Lipingzhangella halophila]
MSRSKDIGTVAETAVVRYLQAHGWPSAERRALAGEHDLGDITGCPGLVWEVKSGRAAENAGDGLINDWLAETVQERVAARADVGVLVTKRAGYGPARAASWWAHLTIGGLRPLLGVPSPVDAVCAEPIRMHLSTAVGVLRAAGYGDPVAELEVSAR